MPKFKLQIVREDVFRDHANYVVEAESEQQAAALLVSLEEANARGKTVYDSRVVFVEDYEENIIEDDDSANELWRHRVQELQPEAFVESTVFVWNESGSEVNHFEVSEQDIPADPKPIVIESEND